MAQPEEKVRRFHRSRIALFVSLGILVCFLDAGYQFIRTLRFLDVTERLRDGWQRPAEIISALDLRQGSTVAEIGCGAGYFALKLAPVVGKTGAVLAEDILKEPLAFLWFRSRSRGHHNLRVVLGEPDNPDLPAGALDAALISNTYHEFRNARRVLNYAFGALRAGGRLVIVDRGPLPERRESQELETEHHELAMPTVERQILYASFDIVGRQDHFIDKAGNDRPGDRSDNHLWWMIIAQKPLTITPSSK